MANWLQWLIICCLAAKIYYVYVHNVLKSFRADRVHVDMSMRDVKRILGKPKKKFNHGVEETWLYQLKYSVRYFGSKVITVRVLFKRGKVYRVDKVC